MEAFAASRPQDGRTSNEDAYLIGRGEIPYAALCAGSGAGGQVAKRALKVFEGLVAVTPVEGVERFTTRRNWTHPGLIESRTRRCELLRCVHSTLWLLKRLIQHKYLVVSWP